jgi:hypothetical protein
MLMTLPLTACGSILILPKAQRTIPLDTLAVSVVVVVAAEVVMVVVLIGGRGGGAWGGEVEQQAKRV